MQSNMARILVGIAAVAAAVILLLVLKDDGGDNSSDGDTTTAAKTTTSGAGQGQAEEQKPAKPAVPTIVIRDGEPVGGIAEISVDEGDQVRFKVKSDISEEVHLHGYDIAKEVEAGGTVSFDFPATIEGIFEAELEHLGEQILELTVNP